MTDVRINAWAKLRFHDPAVTLPRMRAASREVAAFAGHLSPSILSLRGHRQRRFRELRDAAIFCHGVGTCVVGKTVYYADHEDQDFDAVTMYDDGTTNFLPLQLKEVPPPALNQGATLHELLEGLAGKAGLVDTVVAVKFNRQEALNLSAIKVPRLRIGQLWVFGATSPSQDDWILYGDLMKSPALYRFTYPA